MFARCRPSDQFVQQPVWHVAVMWTQLVGGRVAEDDGSLGELEHRAGRLPGGVGEVDDHPQPVHLLHHGLETQQQLGGAVSRRS